MRYRYVLALIGLAGLTSTAAHSTERRFFPQFVMMRGGGLPSPIVLKHNTAAAAGIGVDSIQIVYESRIYLPANGEPALWENPVVAPGSAQRAFYKLGEPGLKVLEQRGLKLR